MFKTLELHPQADESEVKQRLDTLLEAHGLDANYFGCIDRQEVKAYVEDHALLVIDRRGGVQPLLEASPLLRGLSRESFVQYRVVFPEQIRSQAISALAEFC